MPAPREYLKGYGLSDGMILAGHQLTSVDVKHETIRTYKEYKYPIVMFWKQIDGKYTQSDLINTLDRQVAADRIIYTSYGNPYRCHFGNLIHHYQDGDHLIVNAVGHCERI